MESLRLAKILRQLAPDIRSGGSLHSGFPVGLSSLPELHLASVAAAVYTTETFTAAAAATTTSAIAAAVA